MQRFAIITAAVGASLALAASASAAVLVTDFNAPFTTGSRYGGFASGVITSNANSLNVQASGFGGFFKDLPPNSVDGTGTNAIQFDVTVNAGDTPNVLAVLGDTDFTELAYRWFTLSPGQHTLTLPLSPVPTLVPGVGDSFVSNPGGTPGLNLADVDYIHIQVDAHGSSVPYDIDFNNLALTTVPEPAAPMGCAMVGLLAARRRR